MARESRGSWGRLAFFAACLSVGVAAVVAVAGLSDSLDEAIRIEARKLLAADLAAESRRPLPPELDEVLNQIPGLRRTLIKEMPTVVMGEAAREGPGGSRLVELKMVDGFYPFYGELKLDPPRPLHELLRSGTTVVGPDLLAGLGLEVGDRIRIGGRPFTIAGIVRSEPDQLSVSFTLGPRVFLSAGGLERAGLEAFGSRIRHRLLIKLPEWTDREQVEEVARQLRNTRSDSSFYEVETYTQAQPALRRGFRRMEGFLGLVALLSLLVGGIGVAQAVQAWLAGRMDAIAVLKSLGARSREILALYLGQTTLLGFVGSLLGVAGGFLILGLLPWVLRDLLPVSGLRIWQPWAALRGLGLGLGVALIFALPPLLEIRRVSPARVFRRDVEPLPARRAIRWGVWILFGVGIGVLAAVQSGSTLQGSQFAIGILFASGILAGVASLISRGVGRVPKDFARVWVRHGLAALRRPGAGTLGAILALGLGIVVVLAMYLIQSRLRAQFEAELPRDVPTAFLVDIQPHQWEPVRELLEAQEVKSFESVPVVMARLRSVDGKLVKDLMAELPEDGRRRWVLTREQRLTYMKMLPADNEIVEGALWSDPEKAEISIEKRFAEDMGAVLGSTVVFDIQGVPIELKVSSLRTVEWETFGINFFLIAEPGILDEAPQFRLATVRLPRGSEQEIQDALAERFPNVTFLKVREILEKVLSVMDRLGLGIRVVGGFTVLAGIIILGGVVSSGSIRRAREVALLKTLGMTRLGVVSMFAVEYALVGLVAGIIGSAGAGVLAWAVLTWGMEAEWKFQAGPQIAAVLISIILTVAAGIVTSAPALTRRPAEVLREE